MRVLSERWVMTLALADAQSAAPYPTPLFYALDRSPDPRLAPRMIFASAPTSHHGILLGAGPTAAAAAVYLETEDAQAIAGAQLRGIVVRDDHLGDPEAAASMRARYLARHPQAASVLDAGHQLYALTPTWAKLTDNRLGFGVHPVVEFDAPF